MFLFGGGGKNNSNNGNNQNVKNEDGLGKALRNKIVIKYIFFMIIYLNNIG